MVDLDAAEALADAATPGPWTVSREEAYDHMNGSVEYFAVDMGGVEDEEADAEFIAQARTLVPALIAEVRKEREHRRVLQRECELAEAENRHLANNLDVARAGRTSAESTLAKIKAADPDLFDPDEDAEDKVYETYGSNGRYLREDFLAAMKEHDEH